MDSSWQIFAEGMHRVLPSLKKEKISRDIVSVCFSSNVFLVYNKYINAECFTCTDDILAALNSSINYLIYWIHL